jgi:hypothetical protein
MDIESNAIHHADPDTTDRVSDQLSLSQVASRSRPVHGAGNQIPDPTRVCAASV